MKISNLKPVVSVQRLNILSPGLIFSLGVTSYKIYISQDGFHKDVSRAVETLQKLHGELNIVHVHHEGNLKKKNKKLPKTVYIAKHYGWGTFHDFPFFYFHALLLQRTNSNKTSVLVEVLIRFLLALSYVFSNNHTHVIVLEDDMVFSQDFLEIFVLGSQLMYYDPSVFCVSSWNDYGHKQFKLNSSLFFRTEYFPGLGTLTYLNFFSKRESNCSIQPHYVFFVL